MQNSADSKPASPAAAPPSPEAKLFRDEVIKAQGQGAKLLGEIILTPKLSMSLIAFFAILSGLAILTFLVLGTHTRRATVTGQLVPTAGVIRVQTPQVGVVLEKYVVEGQVVKKGDVLFVLTSDRVGAGAREIQLDIGQQVDQRKRSLEDEVYRNQRGEAGEVGHLQRRVETLRAEGASIDRQIGQQLIRLKLAEEAYKRYQGLAAQDYIAREQLFQKEAELTEQQSRLQALQRDALVAQRELETTSREIENTRVRYANLNAQLQRNVSSAQQEMTEVEARRRVVVTAPEGGRATLIAGEVGQAVDTGKPLLNILPENSQLEARLYAPSRTIGFIRKGDQVLIRYQSFPFQKFGQYDGVVQSIATTAVPSTELTGLVLPDTPAGEPIFAITVSLKQQAARAYGQSLPLQAGMRLDADILQETRRLYEWMLEPLYTMTGKM